MGVRNDGYKIAILGATSQIARDMSITFANLGMHHLHLFARRTDEVRKWLAANGLLDRYAVGDFSEFSGQEFDAVINFVGVGNPAQAAKMGASILDVTYEFDSLALNYVQNFPSCRYIFLSSGAAYGGTFSTPANENTTSSFSINKLLPTDWYGAAKMFAECRHRALPELPIVDLRVFNYFSKSSDINARFLITDILRSIRDRHVFQTSNENIVRDYIGPNEFMQVIQKILMAPPQNVAVDCFTQAPVDKVSMLEHMRHDFGLRYVLVKQRTGLLATGSKVNYYSKNRKATDLFGYFPDASSLQVVLEESRCLLNKISDYRQGSMLALQP